MGDVIIRPAIPDDAEGPHLHQSAEHHAKLDPERYSVPAIDPISARYRDSTREGATMVKMRIIAVREQLMQAAEKWGLPGRGSNDPGIQCARCAQAPSISASSGSR